MQLLVLTKRSLVSRVSSRRPTSPTETASASQLIAAFVCGPGGGCGFSWFFFKFRNRNEKTKFTRRQRCRSRLSQLTEQSFVVSRVAPRQTTDLTTTEIILCFAATGSACVPQAGIPARRRHTRSNRSVPFSPATSETFARKEGSQRERERKRVASVVT